MSYNLIINSSNVSNTLNNSYVYNFIKGSFEIPENAEIMLTSFQIPYSWYNITSRYNNSFKIYFPIGTNIYASYTVTLPDGFYTTTSLNAYIQQFCIKPAPFDVSWIVGSGSGTYNNNDNCTILHAAFRN